MSENTIKNFYFPDHASSDDDEGTLAFKVKKAISRKRTANSIDAFFEKPSKKPKLRKCSNVAQSAEDGVAYLSSGKEDAAYASHLIKIEIYEMEKIKFIAPTEQWKHAAVRLKYYSVSEEDENLQSARDVIYNITKQLASKDTSVKYFIETDKKKN